MITDNLFIYKWEKYLHIEKVDGQKTWGNNEFSFIIDILNKYIIPHTGSSNLKLLDVGCGDGYLMYLLKNMGFDIYGITYKVDEKEYANQHDPIIANRILIGDLHSLPYLDNDFDICISRQSLEHCLSPVVALWEIHRVLKYKGFLLLHVPNNSMGIEDGSNPTHHYAFMPKQWINMIDLNGFSLQESGEDVQYGGFFIVAKRKNNIPLIR